MKDGEEGLTVGDQLRDIRRDMVGAVDENTRAFAQTLAMMAEGQTYGARGLREDFINAVIRANWQPNPESIREILATGCLDLISRADKLTLDSLIFPESLLREEMIATAHNSTFNWALDDGPSEWVSLPKWLEDDTAVPYWITGKPGSGKSTLMKYLLCQPVLKQHLHKWAGDRPLLFGAFYLWNAHMGYGKTLEGLLRILLSQVLSLMPDLIPLVAPRPWALFSLLESDPPPLVWRLPDLIQAFHRLGKEGESRFKLILFIDGMDELDGNHEALIQFIDTMRTEYRIKFCVTSRPWPIFADAFNRSPSFRMHDLTSRDISNYVTDRLGASNAYLDLRRLFPAEMDKIQVDMVEKAQGVFLWVSIVMDLLLKVMAEDPQLPVLQGIMASLPGNLSDLYNTIWQRIDPTRITRASKLIQLVDANSGSLSCEVLWLADEDNFTGRTQQSHCVSSEETPPLPARTDAIISIIKRTVVSNTGGILEVSTSGNITFLHRTARDWVRQPEIWERICAAAPMTFSPFMALARVAMMRLACDVKQLSKDEFRESVFRLLALVSRVESGHPCTPHLVTLLDELNTIGQTKITPLSTTATLGTAPETIFHTNHWTRELYNIQEPCEYSFMGLVSAFAILPYIEAKIFSSAGDKLVPRHPALETPSRLTKKNFARYWNWDWPEVIKRWREMPYTHRLSILENAIFGWGLRVRPETGDSPAAAPRYLLTLPTDVSAIVPFGTLQRLELVRGILRAGANPMKPSLSGRPILKGLRENMQRAARETGTARRHGISYWAKILTRDKIDWRGNNDYEIKVEKTLKYFALKG